MKYIVLVGDGMADYPIKELRERTPLEVARTPNMDFIAEKGLLGRIKTIPDKTKPGSDVAMISILGYDPLKYYTGRGPLEAANLGVELSAQDVAFRCNLVTVSKDTLVDYSSGHISSHEAANLIKTIDRKLGTSEIKFYPGVSYRHVMLVKSGADKNLDKVICMPPHDIVSSKIADNLPKGKNSQIIIDLMQKSREILQAHEINIVRIDLKENPANMIWLWSPGKKPNMPSFLERYGLRGSVISAVDLIKGLGRVLGMEVIDVAGATGYYDTDYKAKAEAAIDALRNKDFVFLHVEAPDEASHNGDLREKITAIERFDNLVVGTILEEFKRKKSFRILVLPDHATPLSLRTHTADEVFFAIYGKGVMSNGLMQYNEKQASQSKIYIKNGYELMDYFIKGVE
jgi:2,3-bisphosphoglycerate-independent phosphoglycerate mutase